MILFFQIFAKIVDNILKPKNELGWNATKPSGSEGDNLMRVMGEFSRVVSRSLIFHVIDMRSFLHAARVDQFLENIGEARGK